jgi:hypothetical protein
LREKNRVPGTRCHTSFMIVPPGRHPGGQGHCCVRGVPRCASVSDKIIILSIPAARAGTDVPR